MAKFFGKKGKLKIGDVVVGDVVAWNTGEPSPPTAKAVQPYASMSTDGELFTTNLQQQPMVQGVVTSRTFSTQQVGFGFQPSYAILPVQDPNAPKRCESCGGSGKIKTQTSVPATAADFIFRKCTPCNGLGWIIPGMPPAPEPIPEPELPKGRAFYDTP